MKYSSVAAKIIERMRKAGVEKGVDVLEPEHSPQAVRSEFRKVRHQVRSKQALP